MNRQSANYVESVGDNKHYEWQTPWHNRWMWLFTVLLLAVIFGLFYLQNKVHKEEFIIRFDEYDQNVNDFSGPLVKIAETDTILPAFARFDVEIQHDYSGDFSQKTNLVNIYPNKDLKNYVAISTITQLDTTVVPKVYYELKIEEPLKPKWWQHDTVLVDKLLTCEIDLVDSYFEKILSKGTLNPIDTTDELQGNCIMSYNNTKNDNNITHLRSLKFFSQYVYNGQIKKDARTIPMLIYLGNSKWWRIFNINSSCITIKKGGMKLPRAKKRALHISYQSPMTFDVLSLQPDSISATSVVFSSPEKLKNISDNGLTIVARSVANANFQETLNFVYATLIGLIFSFFVEFSKRLYNYRRQKIYEAGWKYIPVISVIKSILLSVNNRVRKILNRKENIIEESK